MGESVDSRIDPILQDAFKATARPNPSPYFKSRLRATLAEERRRRKAVEVRLRIMQAYWLFSAVVTLCILSSLVWRNPPQVVWIPLIMVAALLALPAALFRVDPVALVLGSVRHLREGR